MRNVSIIVIIEFVWGPPLLRIHTYGYYYRGAGRTAPHFTTATVVVVVVEMGILWFFRRKKVERSAVWWSVDLTTVFLPSGFSSVNARWFRPTNRRRILYYTPCTRVRPSCPYVFNQFSNQTSRPPWRRQRQVVWTHCRILVRTYTRIFSPIFFPNRLCTRFSRRSPV